MGTVTTPSATVALESFLIWSQLKLKWQTRRLCCNALGNVLPLIIAERKLELGIFKSMAFIQLTRSGSLFSLMKMGLFLFHRNITWMLKITSKMALIIVCIERVSIESWKLCQGRIWPNLPSCLLCGEAISYQQPSYDTCWVFSLYQSINDFPCICSFIQPYK